MSQITRAVINAFAAEMELVREAARDVVALSIPANHDVMRSLPSPRRSGVSITDFHNRIHDPQGLGSREDWRVENGVMRVNDDLDPMPEGWRRAVEAAPTGGQLRLVVDAERFGRYEYLGYTTAEVTLPTTTIPVDSIESAPGSGALYLSGQRVSYGALGTSSFDQVSGGEGTFPAGTPVTIAQVVGWWYAFTKADQPYRVRLVDEAGFGYPARDYGVQGGWVLVGSPAALQAGVRYSIAMETPESVLGGTGDFWMTGATIVSGEVLRGRGTPEGYEAPQAPIAGSLPDEPNFAYDWVGAANGSPSIRRGRAVDLLSLHEREAGLDPAPLGLNVEQRRAYLLRRRQARHHGSGATFVSLLVALLQTDDPSFDASRIRVVENHAAGTFRVAINYSPTGLMMDRVMRLIQEIKPAGLAMEDVEWGGFRAGINRAGDAV